MHIIFLAPIGHNYSSFVLEYQEKWKIDIGDAYKKIS